MDLFLGFIKGGEVSQAQGRSVPLEGLLLYRRASIPFA